MTNVADPSNPSSGLIQRLRDIAHGTLSDQATLREAIEEIERLRRRIAWMEQRAQNSLDDAYANARDGTCTHGVGLAFHCERCASRTGVPV